MTDPIAPSPAQPGIPPEAPQPAPGGPDYDPGGAPLEAPPIDTPDPGPGDWRPHD